MLGHNRRTAQRGAPVEILPTAAELNEKSRLKRPEVGG